MKSSIVPARQTNPMKNSINSSNSKKSNENFHSADKDDGQSLEEGVDQF